ncbi:MAG TPA: hypothetical protein ENH82_07720 [bacterium]|nr:hypothetical protein [bacterium]
MEIPNNIINMNQFEKVFRELLNHSMIQAAEPILQQALQDIEAAMRKELAKNTVELIEKNYDVTMRRDELVITIKQAVEKQ